MTGAGTVINTANIQAGDSVVVVGAGGVGLNSISGAKVAGATTIVAVDVADDKLATEKKFGATHTVNSTTEDAVARVQEITGGATAVVDFVGIGRVTQKSLDVAARGGGLYLVGNSDTAAELNLSIVGLIGSKKRIQGVYMDSTTPNRDIRMVAELYLAARYELDALVSKEIALQDVNDGYEALKDPSVNRVVITQF